MQIGILVLVLLCFLMNIAVLVVLGQVIKTFKLKIESLDASNNMIYGLIDTNLKKVNDNFDKSQQYLTIAENNVKFSEKNAALLAKHKDYRQTFAMLLEVLQEDTEWIRSTFFQRFASVPEYQAINSDIINFQIKLNQIRNTLREFRMIDEFNDE